MSVWVPLVFLIPLIREDFKTRSVHIGWLVLFGLSTLLFSVFDADIAAVLLRFGCNSLVVAYLYLCLCGYVGFRTRKWSISLRGYIGSGDWWFMVCLTPVFELRTFVLFLVLSLFFSLLLYAFYAGCTGPRTTVPLVGTIGIAYFFFTVVNNLIL